MAVLDFLNDNTNLVNQTRKMPQIGDVNFTIYTAAILDDDAFIGNPEGIANNEDVTEDIIAVEFQGLRNFYYKSQINVPYEPLENGEFSSDSLLGTPFMISIVAKVAPAFNISDQYEYNITNDEDRREYIRYAIKQLEIARDTEQLLVLVQSTPLFKTYYNLKLTNFDYELSPNELNLEAYLQFQEIRMTNSIYGTATVKTTAKSQYADATINGNVTAPDTTNKGVLDKVS